MGLNHSNTILAFVALGDVVENDRAQDRALNFPAGSIIVFNKGYIDYQCFVNMSNRKMSLVTQLRPKTVYEIKLTLQVLSSKGILADKHIELSSNYAKKCDSPKPLKYIEFFMLRRNIYFNF